MLVESIARNTLCSSSVATHVLFAYLLLYLFGITG